MVVLLWLTVGLMPRRFVAMQNLAANYYDRQMSLQEYRIHKEEKQLAENKNATEEEKLESLETLAKNLWATFRAEDASHILENVRLRRENLNPNYNQKLINTLILLGAVYRDMNQLIPSAECYEKVWNLDKENLPSDDSRLVRDQTNMAMLDFVRGDSDSDEQVRHRFFESAIEHIKLAKQIWHKQKEPDTAALANLFYYEYLCYRELGDNKASRQAYGESKYLNRLLKRDYSPPWT